ncbi:reverse transcriptase, partial [Globisporangium splendens]
MIRHSNNGGMGNHAGDPGRRTPDLTPAPIPTATQVEGELVGKLSDATQVYKDQQSTGRIVEAILQAARFRNDGKMELSDEMGLNDDLLPTPIGATQIRAPDGDNRRATGGRQRMEQAIGSGRTTGCRIEIQTTGKRFHAYPLDKYGPRSHHSQLWEVLFEVESCPKRLSISTELFGEGERSSFTTYLSTEWHTFGKDRVFGVSKQCRMWGDKRNCLTHSLELQACTSRMDGLPRAMDEPNIDESSTQPLPASCFQPHSPARSTIFALGFGKALRVHYSGTFDRSTETLVYRHIKHPSIVVENESGNTCVMQVRAVAHRMRTLKGEKIDATCLSQLLSALERQDLSRQLEAWRLYFDGDARGNPGPGGSGWAFIFLNEHSNRWELKACGYAYMEPEVTNNWCEYSALKDGLAYSAHYLQHYEVKLEVFGDSQMIIAAQNGFASIRQTKLQPLAVRVNQIIANFAWTSWNHTKREQNKMADLLANMAMNSKSAKILTDESRGNDQVVMSQVAALLDNDIGATPSQLRNTSLSAVLTRLRNS